MTKMREFNIGKVIKALREEKGLTQAELSDGICEAPTLSRIEAGTQSPGIGMIDSIMGRLGVVGSRYHFVADYKELELEEIKEQIKNETAQGNIKEAIELRYHMIEKYNCQSNIMKQFILWREAINGEIVDGEVVSYSNEDKLKKLNEAIRITVPNFDEEYIHNSLFSLNETIILVNIANVYMKIDENFKAIDLYRQIYKYIKHHLLDLSESTLIIPLLTFNYSTAFEKVGNFKKELEIAQEGIDCCVRYGKGRPLGALLINKSFAQYKLGIEDNGKAAGIESYYVLKANNEIKDAGIVLEHMKKTYGWEPN